MQGNQKLGGTGLLTGPRMSWTDVLGAPMRIALHRLKLFFGDKPDLSDLRIFGCVCFPLVLPSQHKHLTPRAQRGVFVGVDEERRGYRVVLDGMHTYIQ